MFLRVVWMAGREIGMLIVWSGDLVAVVVCGSGLWEGECECRAVVGGRKGRLVMCGYGAVRLGKMGSYCIASLCLEEG